jgi:hypothetical protein
VRVPYETELQAGWAEKVDCWRWQKMGSRSWRKTGNCPRCKHEMTVDYNMPVLRHLLPALRISSETSLRSGIAACNCSHPHEGHPAQPESRDDWGCGQQARIAPPA